MFPTFSGYRVCRVSRVWIGACFVVVVVLCSWCGGNDQFQITSLHNLSFYTYISRSVSTVGGSFLDVKQQPSVSTDSLPLVWDSNNSGEGRVG